MKTCEKSTFRWSRYTLDTVWNCRNNALRGSTFQPDLLQIKAVEYDDFDFHSETNDRQVDAKDADGNDDLKRVEPTEIKEESEDNSKLGEVSFIIKRCNCWTFITILIQGFWAILGPNHSSQWRRINKGCSKITKPEMKPGGGRGKHFCLELWNTYPQWADHKQNCICITKMLAL